MESAVLKLSSQSEARRLSQVRLKGSQGCDPFAEEEVAAGSDLSVASNADSDSENKNLSNYSSDACSGASEWRPLNILGESGGNQNETVNQERISRTSSWEDCRNNPSEIVKLILKEAESSKTVWTNDQHSSYLNSMEAAFVRNMFGKSFYAAEQCEECTELRMVKESKSRGQQRCSSSSPYSRFRSKAKSYNEKPVANCSINVRIDLKASINAQLPNHLNCVHRLNRVQDSQTRELNMPKVPELEFCASQYAFINYQPTSRSTVSEKAWADTSQGKHMSHKFENHLSEQFSIVEKNQNGTRQGENGESDQVVPSVFQTDSQHIEEPLTIADTKYDLELKNSLYNYEVGGVKQ